MAKKFFTKCIACYFGEKHDKTQRLPRKKKKKLKNFLTITYQYRFHYSFEIVSSCDIVYSFNYYKKCFNIIGLITKFKNEIDFLQLNSEEESIFIDEKGRLCWYWEYDDDFGGISGLMPFCYSEEEAKDTWSFSQLKGLIYNSFYSEIKYNEFQFPSEIKSDKDLLNFIRKQNVQKSKNN